MIMKLAMPVSLTSILSRRPHLNPIPQAGEEANESLREFHVNYRAVRSVQSSTHSPQHAKMLSNLFSNPIYVRIKRNQFRIRHIDSGIETTVQSETPFTTVRMLVGEYTAAEKTLKAALKKVTKSWLRLPPHVVIQPLEMIEGGLSQIEERILHELAIGAGASKVVVWLGSELSDAEVKEKLNGK